MADRRRVRWDEAVLSKNPRRCRTSSYDRPLPSPYPPTDDVMNVYGDSTDTEDTLTDTDTTLIGKDGPLTDSDDTLNYIDDALVDTDGALVNTDHIPTKTDDILIDKNGAVIDSKDDQTDADDTLIGKDVALTDKNDAPPKTDYSSLTMKFILSIDDGGIRGYSTLTILQALMEEIEEIERADNPKPTSSICASTTAPLNDEHCAIPKPASTPRLPHHYFDYIGGSGSGNVIAMMLAENKMSVAEVTDAYRDMCAPGGKRRLVDKKVVFSKKDRAYIWLQDHTMKPVLAWASHNKQEGAIPACKADPLHNNKNKNKNKNNNPSRKLLADAHFHLLDDPSANKNGIYLLSIGSALTSPVEPSADPSHYHLSKHIQTVHKEPSLQTSPSNPNPSFYNLKRYVRLEVQVQDTDDDLGDIGVDEWDGETANEAMRRRIVRATHTYLQRREIREKIHRLAVCLVNRRRFRGGSSEWRRRELGISHLFGERRVE